MLDEDEFEAEISMFRAPSAPATAKKKRFSDYYHNDDDEDNNEPPPPSVMQQKASSSSRRQVSRLLEEEDDEAPPPARKLNRMASFSSPGATDNAVKPAAGPVPYRLQEAASLLLNDRRLSKPATQELTVAYLQRPHEFITVDPLILVCASVDTGTTRIYCKETIPVSLHWMALALDAPFSLQVTPKVRTQEESWADAITARPCRAAQVSERVQPVGTLKAVQVAVARLGQQVPVNLDQQVERYMAKLGAVDSLNACDPEWARDHVDALRAICRGQRRWETEDDNTGIKDKLGKMK